MYLRITFWGVRGSRPTPEKDKVLFGGNTSCVQIELSDKNLILDGGTGIINLGNKILEQEKMKDIHLFFSHLHWDHIQGLPFFRPLYHSKSRIYFYGENKGEHLFQKIIEQQMEPPYFPVSMKEVSATCKFISIKAGQKIDLGDEITIHTFGLNHPGGSLAFRIEKGSLSVVYCVDTEPIGDAKEWEFLNFLQGAGLFIYDANFTQKEYFGTDLEPCRKDWGHSFWEEGVRLSKAAGIKQLILFHHLAERSDQELMKIEKLAQKKFPNTIAAKEEMTIILGGDSSEEMVINHPD